MHSWPEHHPTWRYLFWSWEDTQLAVQSALPQYEQLLKLVGDHRMRLDIGRYVALYLVGGVSVESDVECLATLSDDITIGHETFFISKPEIVKKILYDGKWRPDISILGSRPGHHFWLLVLDEIARNVEQGSCRNRDDCSGANLIAALYDHTEGPTKAIVLESQALFPTLSEADRIEMRRVCKNGGNGDDSLQWECDELEHLLTRRRTMATQGFGIIHGIPDQSHTLAVANIVDVIPPSRLERPFEDPSQWPWWPRKKQ